MVGKAQEVDSFTEKHWNDPREIVWQDVVTGLRVMGLDVTDDGDSIIEVIIKAEHLEIKRCRQNANVERDEFPSFVGWTVTKDIVMRNRKYG